MIYYKTFKKIQEKIPQFVVDINRKQMFIKFLNDFDTKFGKINNITCIKDGNKITSYTKYNNDIHDLVNIDSVDYNFMDALRDSLLILVDEQRFNMHNTIDINFDLINPNHSINISDFSIMFNPEKNRVIKPRRPYYYNQSYDKYITTDYGVQKIKSIAYIPPDDNEPDCYINFSKLIKICNDLTRGLNFVNTNCCGIHLYHTNDIINKIAVFPYNSYLDRGGLIFEKKDINLSFFDACDMFDILNILLNLVINDESTIIDEYDLDNIYIPVEL